jgi:hypothetical protein
MAERTGLMGEREPNSSLEHPFFKAVEDDARSAFSPEDFKAFKRVLKQINHQAIDSFTVVNSQEFPGTSFSTFCLEPTEKLVREIQGREVPAAETARSAEASKKRIFYFLEPHFHVGSIAGGPFWMLGAATDRYLRELPKAAVEIQQAKPDEEPLKTAIQIIPLGSPVGFKGRVGNKFAREAIDDGFNAYGKLYAEYIEKVIGEMEENTRIVIHGASRSAVTGERTYHYLIARLMEAHTRKMRESGQTYGDEEAKEYKEFLFQHIQGLYDEPAGIHKKNPLLPFKAANFAGLFVEDSIRRYGFKEPFLSPDYDAKETNFLEQIGADIPADTPEELKRKQRVAAAEYLHLGLGTPPDLTEPGHYRSPIFDPTNTKIIQVVRELLGINKERADFSKGLWSSDGRKKFSVLKRGGHYHVPWRDSYSRWAKNIAACRRWAPNPLDNAVN